MLKHQLGHGLVRFFATCMPSEWCSITIDVPGLVGNGGRGREVLDYGGGDWMALSNELKSRC